MSQNDDLEQDIRQSLKQMKGMLYEDKVKTLKLLMDKYIHLNNAVLLMTRFDFDQIKGGARNMFIDRSWPKQLEGDVGTIHHENATTMCLIESTIQHLNGAGCLKRSPKFNYKG